MPRLIASITLAADRLELGPQLPVNITIDGPGRTISFYQVGIAFQPPRQPDTR